MLKKTNDSEDVKMIKLIELDISRTHTGLDLFDDIITKEALVDILVIYYKQYQVYKQGMNEVLSVVYFACHPEFKTTQLDPPEMLENLLQEANFLIIVYKIFEGIMNTFLIDLFVDSEKRLLFGGEPLEDEDDLDMIIASKINKIAIKVFYHDLYRLYRELFDVLHSEKIEPYVVTYRCLVCLFAREFDLNDTLLVWDTFLFHSFIEKQNKYKMLECLLIAYFVCKQKELLDPENIHSLLEIVMNEPVEDVRKLLELAVEIKKDTWVFV